MVEFISLAKGEEEEVIKDRANEREPLQQVYFRCSKIGRLFQGVLMSPMRDGHQRLLTHEFFRDACMARYVLRLLKTLPRTCCYASLQFQHATN